MVASHLFISVERDRCRGMGGDHLCQSSIQKMTGDVEIVGVVFPGETVGCH